MPQIQSECHDFLIVIGKSAMEFGIKERIIEIMGHEDLASSKFADTIGIQRSAMSHIMSGRNKPSLDVVQKILERFTYVDSDWLLTGKGEMVRANVSVEPPIPLKTGENQVPVQAVPENREDFGVNMAVNKVKSPVIEQFTSVDKPAKTISKIMVFYTDNTFDTFILEKGKKE